MRGAGKRPGPDLLGALLNDVQLIRDQMGAALSG
jgi:hypothetical protein